MPIRKPVWLVLICAIIAWTPDLHAGAIAYSTLHLFDMKFNLTDTEGVSIGTPFNSVNRFGRTRGGRAGTQQNWREPPNPNVGPFDPDNLLSDYQSHMFNGPVVASAPPTSFIDRQTGRFYDFYNFSSDPTDIDVYWNARYSLSALGNFSAAAISVRVGTKDLLAGGGFQNMPPLIDDSVVNDQQKLLQPASGSFVISIPGATEVLGITIPSVTELRRTSEVSARASVNTPEPAYAGILFLSVSAMLYVRRKHPS